MTEYVLPLKIEVERGRPVVTVGKLMRPADLLVSMLGGSGRRQWTPEKRRALSEKMKQVWAAKSR